MVFYFKQALMNWPKLKMDNNTIKKLIASFNDAMPRKILEMDKKSFLKILTLKYIDGSFLWMPPPTNNFESPGRFYGIEISIAKEKCFQLRFQFQDGHSHVVKLDIDELFYQYAR